MIARTAAEKAEQHRLLVATLELSNLRVGGVFVYHLILEPAVPGKDAAAFTEYLEAA